MDVQIQCINKTNRTSAHERISHVGGIHAEKRWHLDLDAAIAGVEDGRWQFWTMANGRRVEVVVQVSASGRKYLKTQNDGEQPNNLLSLPECPR